MFRIASCLFLCFVMTQALFAVNIPPLTEPQTEQLSTAVDRSTLDEGALYPLLQNASRWANPPAEANYLQMLSSPENFRGEIMTIRGEFGHARTVQLARPGPWGETATLWGVRVAEGQVVNGVKQPDFNVAILFAGDGTALANPGKPGTKVEVICRFYKIWQSYFIDANGASVPANYLTFVSSPVGVVSVGGRASGSSRGGVPGSGIAPPASSNSHGGGTDYTRYIVIIVVIAVGMGYYLVRRFAGRRGVPPTRRQRERRDAREELEERRRRRTLDEAAEDDPQAQGLPQDPAQAMQELERRHREASQD